MPNSTDNNIVLIFSITFTNNKRCHKTALACKAEGLSNYPIWTDIVNIYYGDAADHPYNIVGWHLWTYFNCDDP